MTIDGVLREKLAIRERRWERAKEAGEPDDLLDVLRLELLDAWLEWLHYNQGSRV